MDYAGWITACCAQLEYQVQTANSTTPTGIADFDNSIPACIDYTENRIQRDLDLLNTVQTQVTGTMTANSRLVVLPSVDIPTAGELPDLVGTPIPAMSFLTTALNSNVVTVTWPNHGMQVDQNVSLPTPQPIANLTLGGVFLVQSVISSSQFTIWAPSNANAVATAQVIGNGIFIVCTQIRLLNQPPLEFVSRDFLDYAWPSNTPIGTPSVPVQWTTNNQSTVLVGPAPDQAYPFEAMGTMRIPQLSYTNPSNFLTQQFPDLYVQASLVYWFGQQRDLIAQAGDMKASAEAQYQTLLKSAAVEETRKKFANQFPSPSYPAGVSAQTQGG